MQRRRGATPFSTFVSHCNVAKKTTARSIGVFDPRQGGRGNMQRRWKYSCIMAILATLSVTPHLQAAEMQLPDMRTQPTPQAVLDEHIDALNKCDWNRLVAQYPEDAQIHLLNGTIITGRKAIGELFAGFCKDPKDGGLNGINFKVVQSTLIGGTFATHWVASAPFLAEPYKGSDAYITKDGLMQAMVTTFDGAALKMKK